MLSTLQDTLKALSLITQSAQVNIMRITQTGKILDEETIKEAKYVNYSTRVNYTSVEK